MYENLVEYAEQTLQNTLNRSATSAFSFCVPEFFVGSAFYIQNCLEAYDRIYVGALVPKNRRYYFCSMLKVGGVLIMPYGSKVCFFNSVQKVYGLSSLGSKSVILISSGSYIEKKLDTLSSHKTLSIYFSLITFFYF